MERNFLDKKTRSPMGWNEKNACWCFSALAHEGTLCEEERKWRIQSLMSFLGNMAQSQSWALPWLVLLGGVFCCFPPSCFTASIPRGHAIKSKDGFVNGGRAPTIIQLDRGSVCHFENSGSAHDPLVCWPPNPHGLTQHLRNRPFSWSYWS